MRSLNAHAVRVAAGIGVLALALSGCATTARGPAAAASTADAAVVGDQPFHTRFTTTVIDPGTGAQACTGTIAQSLPPQCTGLVLSGWEWGELGGSFEEIGDTRWGDFLVTGVFDPADRSFVVETAAPAGEDHETVDAVADPWESSPCTDVRPGAVLTPEQIEALDQQLGDDDAQDVLLAQTQAGIERARELDGFATLWTWGDILNVKTTGDVADTEREIREVYAGPLCVASALRAEEELQTILDDVLARRADAIMGAADGIDEVVDITVLYDEGSFQDALDAEFGAGVVRVFSWMTPLS